MEVAEGSDGLEHISIGCRGRGGSGVRGKGAMNATARRNEGSEIG